MSDLRDRLRGRRRPTEPYEMRTADSHVARAADEELARAQRRVSLLEAQAEPDKAKLAKARKDLKTAEQRRAECYVPVLLTAMRPEDFEALQDEYPEAESDDRTEKRAADSEFSWRLFLACAPGEMSEDEWRDVLYENSSQGERLDAFQACFDLNLRARRPSTSVPKG